MGRATSSNIISYSPSRKNVLDMYFNKFYLEKVVNQKVCKKECLSWVGGSDGKIHYLGSLLGLI